MQDQNVKGSSPSTYKPPVMNLSLALSPSSHIIELLFDKIFTPLPDIGLNHQYETCSAFNNGLLPNLDCKTFQLSLTLTN